MGATAVAKRKSEEAPESAEKPTRRTAAVQIEKELARMAAVIASHRGITQSDVCSPALRAYLTAQYRIVKEEIDRELKGLE